MRARWVEPANERYVSRVLYSPGARSNKPATASAMLRPTSTFPCSISQYNVKACRQTGGAVTPNTPRHRATRVHLKHCAHQQHHPARHELAPVPEENLKHARAAPNRVLGRLAHARRRDSKRLAHRVMEKRTTA